MLASAMCSMSGSWKARRGTEVLGRGGLKQSRLRVGVHLWFVVIDAPFSWYGSVAIWLLRPRGDSVSPCGGSYFSPAAFPPFPCLCFYCWQRRMGENHKLIWEGKGERRGGTSRWRLVFGVSAIAWRMTTILSPHAIGHAARISSSNQAPIHPHMIKLRDIKQGKHQD